MYVLLANDDGIGAPGLRALRRALLEAGHEVFTVAPMRQQSGVSHSLTVFEPLRAKKIEEEDFAGIGVHGTPADCVKLALGSLAPRRPDLVMAGINEGPNAGPDIFYSGTIAAAAEGAYDGIPSMAVSHYAHGQARDLERIAAHAVSLAGKIDWSKIPRGRLVNVNYPDLPFENMGPVTVCHQSPAPWENVYSRRDDPRGEPYWWLEGSINPKALGEDSDRTLLAAGRITLTPLRFDHTDRETIETLKGMKLSG